jgi:hypothetical protein
VNISGKDKRNLKQGSAAAEKNSRLIEGGAMHGEFVVHERENCTIRSLWVCIAVFCPALCGMRWSKTNVVQSEIEK